MANLAKNLATKGNHWAVAITTSYFHDEDCENLIYCWDLASIEQPMHIDTHFALSMEKIAKVLHSGEYLFGQSDERPISYSSLLIGAKSDDSTGLDKTVATLTVGKTILNLFWLDSSVEAKIRTAGSAAGRLQQIARDVVNIARVAKLHEKHAKTKLARTSLFDASACEQQLASANAELVELRKHILSIINPVLIF